VSVDLDNHLRPKKPYTVVALSKSYRVPEVGPPQARATLGKSAFTPVRFPAQVKFSPVLSQNSRRIIEQGMLRRKKWLKRPFFVFLKYNPAHFGMGPCNLSMTKDGAAKAIDPLERPV